MSKAYRRNLFCSSALAVSVALTASAALAQDDSNLEEIVVTGSRLQSGFSQPTPVTMLGSQELIRRNPANVLEAINQLPAARPTVSTSGNVRNSTTQAGVIGSVDLRGLGAGRTLVLVDGQRWVAGGFTGVPDTNMFPVSLIDRLEVVTGGASAAYGSDAVAGVVNFVLNDRFEGVKGSLSYGRSKYKDLGQVTGSLGVGTSFAGGKGHFVAGYDYNNNEGGHSVYSRPWGAEEPLQVGTGALGSATRPAGTPAQLFVLGAERNDAAPGALITAGPLRGTTFDANGNPYPFQYGQAYGTSMIGSRANYGFNAQGFTTVGNPFSRNTGYAKVSYDLNEDTTVWASGQIGRVRDLSYGGPPYLVGPYTISVDNPYLPAATRAAAVAAGQSTLTVSKFLTGLGYTGGISQTQHTFTSERFAGGAKGKILGDWKWDAYVAHGRHNTNYYVPYAFYTAAAAAAVNAVRNPVTGAIECGPIATNPNLNATTRALVPSGCTPFNLFGNTAQTQASVDYITNPITADITSKQSVGGFNLNGSPFSSWAGEVSVALGAEARWESLRATTDALSQAGVYSQSNQSAYFGKNNVQEGYLEAGIPLARDMALAKSLDLNLAGRVTHYKVGGTVGTWKIGGNWDINDAFKVRVTRSRDIRAASLYELYGILQPQLAVGITSPFTNVNGNVLSGQNGNPNLTPEKADTFTAGLVFQPTGALSGFKASVDYFSIDIKDVIAFLTTQEVLNGCGAGNAIYCGYVTRDAANALGVSRVDRIGDNLLNLKTSGFDFELSYKFADLGPVPGALNIRFLGTYTNKMQVQTPTTTVNYVGSGLAASAGGGVPKFRGTLDIEYTVDRLRTNLQLAGFTHMKVSPLLVGPDDPAYNPNAANSISKNLFPGAIYLNWSGSYSLPLPGSPDLFWTVNNLLDKAPPRFAIVAFAFGAANYYDMVGRYAQAGVRFQF